MQPLLVTSPGKMQSQRARTMARRYQLLNKRFRTETTVGKLIKVISKDLKPESLEELDKLRLRWDTKYTDKFDDMDLDAVWSRLSWELADDIEDVLRKKTEAVQHKPTPEPAHSIGMRDGIEPLPGARK